MGTGGRLGALAIAATVAASLAACGGGTDDVAKVADAIGADQADCAERSVTATAQNDLGVEDPPDEIPIIQCMASLASGNRCYVVLDGEVESISSCPAGDQPQLRRETTGDLVTIDLR